MKKQLNERIRLALTKEGVEKIISKNKAIFFIGFDLVT